MKLKTIIISIAAAILGVFTLSGLTTEVKASDYTMQEIDGIWRHTINNEIDYTFTGMDENQYGWWYFDNGQLDWNYTGMAENNYGWWYYNNGRLDWNYTGMAENNYGWWYYNDGRLDWNYTGMAKNNYGWWYYDNGRLDWNYTGMAENQYGWWFYNDGRLNWNYTGIGICKYGAFYYINGNIDYSYNGPVTYNGNTYGVENGLVYVGTGEIVYIKVDIYANGTYQCSAVGEGHDGEYFDASTYIKNSMDVTPKDIQADNILVKKANAYDAGYGVPTVDVNVYMTL